MATTQQCLDGALLVISGRCLLEVCCNCQLCESGSVCL
jgi:hypothetical protein